MPLQGSGNADRVRVLKSISNDMAEPRRTVLKCMPDDQKVPNDPIRFWIPTPWDNHGGRVTLAGDAAHPISFRTCFQFQKGYPKD